MYKRQAYNILFFTYVQHLFDPEAKVSIKAFLTPTNITTAIMVVMLVTGLRLPATGAYFDPIP